MKTGMNSLACLILGLLLTSCTSQYFNEAGSFPLVHAEAGIVEQNPGVFINVYFEKPATGGSGSLEFTVKGGTMMLALYTSETILSSPDSDCEGFVPYNCSLYGCEEFPEETNSFVLPYFSADTYNVNSTLYIDTNYWTLTTKASLAVQCTSYPRSHYGQLTYGLLGMGISGDSLYNYVTTQNFNSIMGGSESYVRTERPVFSFFVGADGNSGTLIFQNDANKATSTTPVATLKTTGDWHASGVTAVKIGKATVGAPTKLIFDINAEAIGLPVDVFNKIIKAINATDDAIACQSNIYYMPTCKYSGDIADLPEITVTVQSQTITILPSVYAKQIMALELPTDSITLHLEGLSESHKDSKDPSFVTVDFNNYVILNQDVMGYYYTVFDTGRSGDTEDPSIIMYVANHGTKSKALTVIIVCSVLGAIIGLTVYRYKKIQKQRLAAEEPMLQTRPGDHIEMNLLQGLGSR